MRIDYLLEAGEHAVGSRRGAQRTRPVADRTRPAEVLGPRLAYSLIPFPPPSYCTSGWVYTLGGSAHDARPEGVGGYAPTPPHIVFCRTHCIGDDPQCREIHRQFLNSLFRVPPYRLCSHIAVWGVPPLSIDVRRLYSHHALYILSLMFVTSFVFFVILRVNRRVINHPPVLLDTAGGD